MRIVRSIVWAIVLIVASCVPTVQRATEVSIARTQDPCIPPVTTFAYPTNGKEGTTLRSEPVLPSGKWNANANLPPLPEGFANSSDSISFVRNTDKKSEIWITRDLYGVGGSEYERKIYVYDIDAQEWVEIESSIEEHNIGKLYLAKNGVVFASAWNQSKSMPELGVYNEKEEKFSHLDISLSQGNIYFDQEDFWIFGAVGAIYSLDTTTLELVKHIDMPKIRGRGIRVESETAITFMADGSVYFVDTTPRYLHKEELALFHFFPATDQIEVIPEIRLQGEPIYYNLFADRTGNLWLSDYGWISQDGMWFQIVRSPVFITNKLPEQPMYSWDNPRIVLESSDGRLWFQSTNGMVWLDPKQEDWCWFTTYRSNVVEDASHNLWIIADGKLYQLKLEE